MTESDTWFLLTPIKLEKNSNLARGDDISRAKQKLADLINRSTPTPLPLLEPSSRTNRGFQHDATGLRLCPVAPGYNWEDPEYVLIPSFLCSSNGHGLAE